MLFLPKKKTLNEYLKSMRIDGIGVVLVTASIVWLLSGSVSALLSGAGVLALDEIGQMRL